MLLASDVDGDGKPDNPAALAERLEDVIPTELRRAPLLRKPSIVQNPPQMLRDVFDAFRSEVVLLLERCATARSLFFIAVIVVESGCAVVQ